MKEREGQIRNTCEKEFKDHIAKFEDLGKVKLLEWKKPGSGFYAINYTLRDGYLFVTGDCFEAIYGFSENLTLDFFKDVDLFYFHGKIKGLNSMPPYDWEGEKALLEFKEYISDCDMGADDKEDLISNADNACGSKEAWAEFLREDTSMLDDGDAFCNLYGAGDVIPTMCFYHLEGLKYAIKYLDNKKKVPSGSREDGAE